MIYVVEDDSSIRELVVYALKNTGLEAEGFEKPSEFWKALNKSMPELVILDVMLPEESGIDILKKLRADYKTEKIPVVMATAKTSEYDKINGLESGADDYIAKPFSMMELVARIKALLRRVNRIQPTDEISMGCLSIFPAKHMVKVNGEEVILTLKEYEMLCLLVNNKGMVLTRDQLLNKIWGYNFDGESRTVDVHIRTLRMKLGEAGNLVKTIRGVGYKIDNK